MRLFSYPAEKQVKNAFPDITEERALELLTAEQADEKDKAEEAKGVEQAFYDGFHSGRRLPMVNPFCGFYLKRVRCSRKNRVSPLRQPFLRAA
jgi:hypothetical protein